MASIVWLLSSIGYRYGFVSAVNDCVGGRIDPRSKVGLANIGGRMNFKIGFWLVTVVNWFSINLVIFFHFRWIYRLKSNWKGTILMRLNKTNSESDEYQEWLYFSFFHSKKQRIFELNMLNLRNACENVRSANFFSKKRKFAHNCERSIGEVFVLQNSILHL